MKTDNSFSLGLTYYEIMELSPEKLESFLLHVSREEIIDWLQWNDPNGIYRDEQSLAEFGTIVSKVEGIEIIMRQIRES